MPDDIGADLRAAMEEQTNAEPVETHDDVAADVRQAITETTEAATQAEARARDEQGRFARKTDTAVEQQPAPVKDPTATTGQEPEAQAQTIMPPRSWTPQAKADFATLPKHIQQEVLKREGDIEKGQQEWQTKAQKLRAFEDITAPHREKWALQGVREDQAIGQLLAASEFLDRDPVNAIKWLMQSTGVRPEHLAAQQGQQAQQPQGDPRNDPMRRLQALEQERLQERQSAEQAAMADISRQIETFKADPKHLYFSNVEPDMKRLIETGVASTLEEAYEKATWQHPEIRKILVASESKAEAERVRSSLRAEQARSAGGSVTGGPGLGSSVRTSNPRNSVKDDLLEAYNEQMSGA